MTIVNINTKVISQARMVFATIVLLFIAGTSTAQTKPDTTTGVAAKILQLEQERIQAMIAGDIATQERLMSPDCIHFESSGIRRTTAELMASLRARETTFDIFVIDEAQVRFYGSAAVVTGSYHNAIHDESKPQSIKYARYTRVWAQQADGRWLMVSHQATEMPAPKGSSKSK